MKDTSRLDECDFCGFPTMTREYTMHRLVMEKRETKRLCDFCAHTFCGTAHEYPGQYEGQVDTLRAVAYAANLLLAAGDEEYTHPVWPMIKLRQKTIYDRPAPEEA